MLHVYCSKIINAIMNSQIFASSIISQLSHIQYILECDYWKLIKCCPIIKSLKVQHCITKVGKAQILERSDLILLYIEILYAYVVVQVLRFPYC